MVLNNFFSNFHIFSILHIFFQRSIPKIRIFRFFFIFTQIFRKKKLNPLKYLQLRKFLKGTVSCVPYVTQKMHLFYYFW